jgi:hypothetical protein
MTQHNSMPRYPYALEGDELGQRVYDSLRVPIESTMTRNALSEDSQARLDRATARLATHVTASEVSIDILKMNPALGRKDIEDLYLPAFEEIAVADEHLELN